MKKEDFELLKKSFEQAIAYANGAGGAARVTIRKRPPKQVKVNLLLDEDIVRHFKRRSANGAAYVSEINQTLRAALEQPAATTLPEAEAEALAERIARKVAARLAPAGKRKAA